MNYVYLLKDPVSKVVRYVGKTKNPKSRFKQHLKDAEKRQGTAKQVWIKELKKKKMTPMIEIIAEIKDESEARDFEEKTVIKHIDTVFNIHMPGKGSRSTSFYKKNQKLK